MSIPPNIRQDFPFLNRKHSSGSPWIYLDSAATTLKPRQVIDAVTNALTNNSTNIHRSVCGLGDETTELFEFARQRIARFIGAQAHEIVFVRNTTEALNFIAQAWPRKGATLVSWGEHHSNLLPWQHGKFRCIPPNSDGGPDISALLRELKTGEVSIVSISQVSNVTGIQVDIRELAQAVHQAGAVLVVDAAQSVGRMPIDVLEYDCDFLAFSGHKMYGPTGIGVLYGKAERLLELGQYGAGGGTVESVHHHKNIWRAIPWRYEAGTPPIESVLGLGSAVDFLQEIGMEEVGRHEEELASYARKQLQSIASCEIVGQTNDSTKIGVVSFFIRGESSHVIARTLSDRYGICVRSGFQCAQPLHDHLQISPTIRLSFGIYSQKEEIDRCISALAETAKIMPLRRIS